MRYLLLILAIYFLCVPFPDKPSACWLDTGDPSVSLDYIIAGDTSHTVVTTTEWLHISVPTALTGTVLDTASGLTTGYLYYSFNTGSTWATLVTTNFGGATNWTGQLGTNGCIPTNWYGSNIIFWLRVGDIAGNWSSTNNANPTTTLGNASVNSGHVMSVNVSTQRVTEAR